MVEIPDEYGLSSDSLRGTPQHIRADLVDIDDDSRRDPYTGQTLTRLPLSANEQRILEASQISSNVAPAALRPPDGRMTRAQYDALMAEQSEERLSPEQWAERARTEDASAGGFSNRFRDLPAVRPPFVSSDPADVSPSIEEPTTPRRSMRTSPPVDNNPASPTSHDSTFGSGESHGG